MANQILAGAIINAGMVIAGVDADNPPVTGSTPATDTIASLHINGTASGIVDISPNSYSVNSYGDVVQSAFSPYRSGGYAWQFNGQGNYITKLNSDGTAEFNFTGEDFTVEFWMNLNGSNHSNSPVIMGGQQGWYVQLKNTDSRITFYDNSTEHEADVTLDNNAWYHVAVTRSGSTLRTFLNGTEVYSGTSSTSAGRLYNSDFIIASYSTHPQLAYNGFLSDVHVVKGTALYTENFTAPTEHLTEVAGTTLLTCNEPHLQSGLTITGNVSSISAGPHDAGYSETLHGGSYVFDGNGDYLNVPSEMNFGTEDFTFEGWYYLTGDRATFLSGSQNGSYDFVYVSNSIRIGRVNTAWDQIINHTLTQNTWQHIAFVRSSGTLSVYVDGNLIGAETNDNNYFSGPTVWIGQNFLDGGDGRRFSGNMSDVRIVTGEAVYTENFSVPTSPLGVTETPAPAPAPAPAPTEYLMMGAMWSGGMTAGEVTTFDTSGSLIQTYSRPSNIQYPYANYGKIVATNGVKMAVGAPAEKDGGVPNHGEVTIMDIDGSNPISVIYEDGRDTHEGDEVGAALAMSDNYIYLGVPKAERYGGGSSGIVAVYDLNGNLQSTLTAPNANSSTGGYQFFGTQVGWTGSRMVASAPQNTGNIYWDCYFRVYEENGTFVEQINLPNSKTKLFGNRMNVTGPECTSNKVVLSCRDGNAYVYDLDAADIAGSQLAIPIGPDGTIIFGVAINDSYVYVGLSNSDTVKVYDHSGTFQFDIVPTSDVLTALGETTASMKFGANIETTNHKLAIVTGTNGKIVIYDIQGNNPVPFDLQGGSYSAYWSGGMQFYTPQS